MTDSTTFPAEKRCIKCGEIKPLEAFSIAKANKDGRSGTCKACVNLCHSNRAKRENIDIPSEKRCIRCKVTKSSSKFWKDKRRPDGLAAYCIDCNNAYYQQNAVNGAQPPAEKWCNKCKQTLPASMFTLARKRASGLSTHCKKCTWEWREANRPKLRAQGILYSREHYRANKDRAREKHREWRQKNYNICRAIRHRRQARIAGNGGSFTSQELADLQNKQNGICAYCQFWYPSLSIDHIIPTTQGGTSYISNIALACTACNSSKKDRTPEQWVDRWYMR